MKYCLVNKDDFYMQIALDEAKKAYKLKEVPVGAVVVYNDEIISTGFNMKEKNNNATHHAEILAIDMACCYLQNWRLVDCYLYVTLEPCPMCAGAIINSRIKKVVYAAKDPKAGSCGSVFNMFDLPFNHKPEIVSGVLEEESVTLLKNFFKAIRGR